MLFPKYNKSIKGNYLIDKKTKHLLRRIRTNQIAVIHHTDIDEIAAQGLIEKKVKAIINFSPSFTGSYPTLGLKKILDRKIPVFDVKNQTTHLFPKIPDQNKVEIDIVNNIAYFESLPERIMVEIEPCTIEKWEDLFKKARQNLENELGRFINNTLEHALKEKDFFLKPLKIPLLKTQIKGKHVVVVVRGTDYREDLSAIKSYIEDIKPVLIGVDGGADALLEYGLIPDIILGDMDSVSDQALRSGAEILVHAYPNGYAPGLKRIYDLGLEAKIIPSKGTSEDVAMLLAYEKQAEIIVALGTHSHMVDFLEKGRKGMASTILVRMKIGNKLVDAKGVSKLYHPQVHWKSLSFIGLAATTPILAISMINHDMVRLLQMMWINIKMIFM
ncbi:putative cytokinetic ring protein SteA [Tepidibacillus fermentans]|uniref:Putative membrane-anchored protein n=1 Tax=Tepidibacillus fermentans TaxID=1281767 RepID=A0A4R3KKP0_9BACI|nr:putative cytokinetic ring protein SteA [Tepidibacillus fermentans]TCS84050.1 putative membrane-anchored protein [Tepidibacillus fermentans]